jgi:hypothetical protein
MNERKTQAQITAICSSNLQQTSKSVATISTTTKTSHGIKRDAQAVDERPLCPQAPRKSAHSSFSQ